MSSVYEGAGAPVQPLVVWGSFNPLSDEVTLKLGSFSEELISAAGGRNLDYEEVFAQWNGTNGIQFKNSSRSISFPVTAGDVLSQVLADVDWLIDDSGYASGE